MCIMYVCTIIFSIIIVTVSLIQARLAYNKGRYLESEALCTRARGTAIYSMAIGVGLLVIMGLLLGLGDRFNWY